MKYLLGRLLFHGTIDSKNFLFQISQSLRSLQVYVIIFESLLVAYNLLWCQWLCSSMFHLCSEKSLAPKSRWPIIIFASSWYSLENFVTDLPCFSDKTLYATSSKLQHLYKSLTPSIFPSSNLWCSIAFPAGLLLLLYLYMVVILYLRSMNSSTSDGPEENSFIL